MQTFLPYPNFEDSVHVLDNKRLGKQRVETFQIMQRLLGFRLVTKGPLTGEDLPVSRWGVEKIRTGGWSYHPAVLMWRGYERCFLEYQRVTVDEWVARGFRDSCWLKTFYLFQHCAGSLVRYIEPFWLGDYDFHISHQSNLVHKDPDYYQWIFPRVPDNFEYLWPVGREDVYGLARRKLVASKLRSLAVYLAG